MEKILFIVPPNIKYEAFVAPSANVKVAQNKNGGTFGVVITDMPLGVLSLSAYVKKLANTQTKLVDFNVVLNKLISFEYNSFSDFFRDYLAKQEIIEYRPSLICISALFAPSYQSLLDIARHCRDLFPGACLVAGGGLPTNMYKEIFKDSVCFDALCFGEGERPLLDLAESADKRQCLEANPSWITPKKIKHKRQFKHDFIENLDEIPFFDYDILDLPAYKLNPTIAAYTFVKKDKISFPVMTSRGCPHRCCFCSAHTVHGRRVRYYSPNRVQEDLARLKEQCGAEIIIFQDDHFMANKGRALEIIDILKRLKMTAFFPNSLALYALDREVLEALKSTGVNQLVLSVESGSDRVLREIMHKPLNLSIVKRVANDCRDLGIYTDVNILIGLPGETKQDIEEAGNFLKTINANWFRINVATPLVGSEMLAECLKKKYIKGDYLACDFKKAIIETEDFTVEYIQTKAYDLNLELNFVANSDMRLKNYKTALRGLENAIKSKNDHAFALYYAARCYDKLGKADKAKKYINNAKMIVAKNVFWRDQARKFSIPL